MLLFISFTGKRKSWGGWGEEKKNTVEVCILRMCIIFQRRTSYIRKKEWKKEFREKRRRRRNLWLEKWKNPPSVNTENSSCRFFHVMIGASAGARPPLFLFLFYFLLSFSLFFFFFFFFPRGGKRGVGGVLRGDLSIGIVFIFIKTFLLSIELLQ